MLFATSARLRRLQMAAALSACVAGGPASAQLSEPIQVAGSSTVLPYSQIVAENFREVFPAFRTPIVESGGTGGGFTQFCAGIGSSTIDIANASRPITENEKRACAASGVTEIQEVRFGYDGIVFASAARGAAFELTPRIVFQALAARVVVEGRLVDNPYTRWSQIDPALPDQPIAAFIPAENHGTREVFDETLLEPGCEASGALEALLASGLDPSAAEDACLQVRRGGFVADVSGDYTETLSRIEANPQAIGVFGLAFYEQNQDRLRVASVDGVVPSVETISAGEYVVSRPLFFYVKSAHVGIIPGLKEFVDFFLDDQMIGPDGPLARYGLVPAPDEERAAYRAGFSARTLLAL
ncbi:substrate-binding domain-containing protein [Aureimonas populi]|uniref:Substrate-binding domain-containing protein n=1 Tax=Aureimonas populi TaxID=1701758 RepID=A0ABW5CJD3_9HYPH